MTNKIKPIEKGKTMETANLKELRSFSKKAVSLATAFAIVLNLSFGSFSTEVFAESADVEAAEAIAIEAEEQTGETGVPEINHNVPEEAQAESEFLADTPVEEVTVEEVTEPKLEVVENYKGDYAYDGFAYSLNDEDEATITGYTGTDTEITIPSELQGYPVVAIGSSAFKNNETIKSVVIPNGVTSIGSSAFYGCIKLGTVTFPATLTSLGNNSFQQSGIKTVSLPESLTFIGHDAFYSCTYLTTVKFFATSYDTEDTVLSWGDYYGENYAFKNCTALTTVSFSNYTKTIPPHCFQNCSALKSVTLPKSLETIQYYAFEGCSVLPSITIPENVTSVGYDAFSGCTKLATISFPAKLKTVGDYAFQYSGIKTVSLPESLTYLGDHAFYECDYLTSVSFFATGYGDEYTTLEWGEDYGENYAFKNCDALTTVSFSKYTTTIPPHCFQNCTALRSVTLPASLESIQYYAFQGCSVLPSITIPENVTLVGYYAFSGCTKLATVSFPAVLKTIGDYAFQYTGIKTVSIPDSLTYLGDHAFYECDSLTSVSFFTTGYGDEYTTLEWGEDYGENYAFKNCDALTTVSFSPYTTTIPPHCFQNCVALRSVTLPASLESIQYYAFQGCSVLPSITIPKNVTLVGYYAFSGCTKLETVTLPAKLQSIGDYAFQYTGIKNISIPESLTFIGDHAFYNCTALKTVKSFATSYGDDYTALSWGEDYGENYAFKNCTALTTVRLTPYTYNIPANCFENCTALRSIILPDSVETIDYDAFKNCTNLRGMIIPTSVTDIGKNAFYGCSKYSNTYYAGNKTQWANVTVVADGNSYFTAAPVNYTVPNLYNYVERLYTKLLGRASDPTGKLNWVERIVGGYTAADAAKGFVLSTELAGKKLTNREFVKRMYLTMLNRTPGSSEITRWATTLDNGCSYAYILKRFVASAEFKKLCTNYGISTGTYATTEYRDYNENLTAFVSRMYTKALGRKYDITGLNNHTGRYINGTKTAAGIAESFILSAEFVNRKLTDEQFVTVLYNALFNRAPDAGGKTRWLNKLKSGTSRAEVLKGFTSATEFKNLVASFGL